MNKEYLELYTDYLLSTFGYATATGLSQMRNGQVSHDQIRRFLAGEEYTSKDLWLEVKGTVRKVEREDAVLIFDDTVQEKPYTDENEVMCWHYDHSKGRAVQGFNLLNCLYHVEDISIPVAFELIKKPTEYCDLKTRKRKRASLVTKNELMRDILQVCAKQAVISLCLVRYLVCVQGEHVLHQRNTQKRFHLRPEKQSLGGGERRRLSSQPLHSD